MKTGTCTFGKRGSKIIEGKQLWLTSILLLWTFNIVGQTNTVTSGNWNTGANWSAGVPGSSTNTNVNHAMVINTNITVSGGDYIINQPVNDQTGGTAYTLSISGTGGNQGNFDVKATSLLEGTLNVNSNGTLTVRSGDTLTVGATVFANNSTVLVESGGTLIINGDLTNNNNSTGITINGSLIVNGNFNGGNGSAVTGTGSMSTSGTLVTTGSGSVFGSTGDCNTGPCSGNNLCVTNTIGSAQSICAGSTPNGLTGNSLAGYTYKWQMSTTSSSSGFSDISGASSQNYNPGILMNSTWYRRVVSNGSCTAISSAIKITVNANTWLGGTSSNWNTAANWCGGIPTSTTDVIISSGTTFSPTISGTTSVKSLTINSSATLTKTNGGILNIYGNFSNNGTFMDNGIYTDNGKIIFTGSSTQTMSGNSLTLNNVTINNSNGVLVNTTTTINGILTLSSGTLTTNNNLSQNLYNGAIAGTGTGSISGNVTFFKTIWGDKYHYISSPVSGTVSEWNDDVTLKLGPSYNLYTYNEAINDTNMQVGWLPVTNLYSTLNLMKGYALYFPRWIYNTTLDVTGTYNHTASYTSSSLTNTVCTIPVPKTTSDGWQLMGNPYPSTIDWDAASGWTKTNIANAIYTWDARTEKFVSYINGIGSNGGSRYIGSMQGFFVQVNAPGGTGTLSMNNSVRVTNTLIDVWRTEEQISQDILRLTASSGTYSDETVLRFSNQATCGFDGAFDAYKLLNGGSSPSLYSQSSSIDFSINSLPDTMMNSQIPLALVTGFAGSYTLSADLSGFDRGEQLMLEDRELGIVQNLRENNSYQVQLDKGSYNGRFFINYKSVRSQTVTAVNDQQEQQSIEIGAYQQTIFINFPLSMNSKADVAVYDAIGNKIYDAPQVSFSSGSFQVNLPSSSGIYSVSVLMEGNKTSRQVYLGR